MTTRTFHGSCSCRNIRIEVDLDLAASGTTKCNCTRCWKRRAWSTVVKPAAFRLLQAPDYVSYAFPTTAHGTRAFCKECGVGVFGWGHLDMLGGEYVSIHVSALDDLSPEELVAAPVQYLDGLHDAWWSTPTETRHL